MPIIAGCLSDYRTDNTAEEATTETNTASDAPEFEVDDDGPGEFILLRNQPQEPNGATVCDEFEIAVVL